MADINANTEVLKQASANLKNTAEILELQESTLNEVAVLIENAWRSSSSGELADCVRRVRKNVNKVGNSLRSSARSLNGATLKIQALEAVNAALANK